MEYRRHRLANGLEVVAECNPAARVMACGFFVRTGARDETPEVGGVSHFLEHMLFKGTPTRSAEDVNRELDAMGSHSNARTGEESTIYHAAVLPEFQTPVVELLADIMRPSLRDDDFQTEQQVIIEEIMMYNDQPPYGGFERIMAEYFGDHPLGQSVLGTPDTVGGLTPEQMRDYFQRRYSPDNIALVAAGNVDFNRLTDDCERLCGSWQPANGARDRRSVEPRSGFVVMHKPESTQQYILQLCPGPSVDDPDRYAARALATIVGDDSGSRFYWEFIDTGRAESAGLGNHEYDNAGVLMTWICCDPAIAQDNLDRLARLQERVRSEPITQKELDLAKSKITSHIILASERTESRMFSAGSQWLHRHEFRTPRQIANTYKALTLDEIRVVAEKYPMDRSMTLCVGPRTDLRPAVPV